MKTVGLFKEDASIYYVDSKFVVMDNPCNGYRTTVIMRHPGSPSGQEVGNLLRKLKMKAVGPPWFREDGLWCCEVTHEKYNG